MRSLREHQIALGHRDAGHESGPLMEQREIVWQVAGEHLNEVVPISLGDLRKERRYSRRKLVTVTTAVREAPRNSQAAARRRCRCAIISRWARPRTISGLPDRVPEEFGSQRDEIKLFTEKAFQGSFGYFALLIALLALSKTSSLADVAASMGLRARGLISLMVLGVNLFYFVLLVSCLFAILKRGYFILASGRASADHRWELFSRFPPPEDEPTAGSLVAYRTVQWNIDNYYMIPVVLFIVLGSIWASVVGFGSTSGLAFGVVVLLACFHIVPLWMLWSVGRLNQECRTLVRSLQKRTLEQHPSP